MFRRTTTAIALAAVALAAAGCSARAPQATTPTASQPSATQAADTSAIKPMTADEKRSIVATSFPLEAPLPTGTVQRGEAQGTTAWDYEIVLDATPATVSAWFKEYYGARSWRVASEEQIANGGLSLTMLKSGAQTRIKIEPMGEGKTKASGVLGVGTDVLQLQ